MKKLLLFATLALSINAVAQCPTMTSSNSETICSGTTANNVLTANVSSTFTWIATDNANTTGESITTQTTSTINDALTNNSGSTQTVTYTVTPTATSGGCVGTAQIVTITVVPLDDASFSYSPSTVCKAGGTDPTPTISTTGGTFTCSDANLIINSSTGVITLSSTPVNTYTVTYTTAGQCAASSNFVLNILTVPVPDFTFGTYCLNAANPSPSYINGGTAGVFSEAPAGLNFVSTSTGQVDLTASAPGTYTVSNTINNAGCPLAIYNNTITINPVPTVTINSETICAGSNATLTAAGATTYLWSNGAAAGWFINCFSHNNNFLYCYRNFFSLFCCCCGNCYC